MTTTRTHRCVDHLDYIGGHYPYGCTECGKRLSALDVDDARREAT